MYTIKPGNKPAKERQGYFKGKLSKKVKRQLRQRKELGLV